MRILSHTATLLLATGCFVGCSFFRPQADKVEYPEPEMTMDRYHGEKIKDPFRWLEERYAGEVEEWVAKENTKTDNYLKGTSSHQAIKDRIIALAKAGSVRYDNLIWRGEKLFALKTEPPKNQPILVAIPSADHPESQITVFDPNLSDPNGSVSIDWFVPAPNGNLVAVSLSKDGTDVGDLYIFEASLSSGPPPAPTPPPQTEDGQPAAPPTPPQKEPVEEVIKEVHRSTAGGDVDWLSDSSGFFYTRYPRAGERLELEMPFYQHVYFHEMGTPISDDQYEFGKELEKTAQIDIETDMRSDRILFTVQKGDSGQFTHYLRDPMDGKVEQITQYEDGITNIVFSPKGGIYLLEKGDSPNGRILFLSSTKLPVSKAKKLIPATKNTLVHSFQGPKTFHVSKNKIFVTYQLGGPSTISVYTHRGQELENPLIPEMSNVTGGIVPLDNDEILFSRDSYTEPKGWYYFDPRIGTSSTTRTAISTNYQIDFSDVAVTNMSARSADGAKIPLRIVHRNSITKNGANPTLLIGYGGFGRSMAPRFDPITRIWLDQGGVIAFANTRGGEEFGTHWHLSGKLKHKKNVFKDFAACAKLLTSTGFTSVSKLAIMGTGNGGLLMGAMINQYPNLMKAVIAKSGIFDMVRYTSVPNGEFMVPEYGTLQNKEEFTDMFAYSPYHRIPKRISPPAVLFLAGANDTTVGAFHSRKMAARLRETSKGTNPILFKQSPNTGYGDNMPFMQKLMEEADILTFLCKELGVSFK